MFHTHKPSGVLPPLRSVRKQALSLVLVEHKRASRAGQSPRAKSARMRSASGTGPMGGAAANAFRPLAFAS